MISYLATGVLIGAITLLVLPRTKPVGNSDQKSSESVMANTEPVTNSNDSPSLPSDESRLIDQFRNKVIDSYAPEEKVRAQKMLERYDNDRSLELKLFLFKAILMVVFIVFFVILLNGSLDLTEFYEKIKVELTFYKELLQL